MKNKEWQNIELEDLELSVRTRHCLMNADPEPKTLGDLAACDKRFLMRIPNFGQKSWLETREIIKAHKGPSQLKLPPRSPLWNHYRENLLQQVTYLEREIRRVTRCLEYLDNSDNFGTPL